MTSTFNRFTPSAFNPHTTNLIHSQVFESAQQTLMIEPLSEYDQQEALRFLAERPSHTVFIAGMIRDNGIVNSLNRGTFYACRDKQAQLQAIALIGHLMVVEARSTESLTAIGVFAQSLPLPNLMFGECERIAQLWQHYTASGVTARFASRELLMEKRAPLPASTQTTISGLRLATLRELSAVTLAHADVYLQENGVNPLTTDAFGFRLRTARRIEQHRVWVLMQDDELVFKADIVCNTPEVAYLEGVYVSPKFRAQGYATRCVTQMCDYLLAHTASVSLLVSENNAAARALYDKAGFALRSYYDTIYPQVPKTDFV